MLTKFRNLTKGDKFTLSDEDIIWRKIGISLAEDDDGVWIDVDPNDRIQKIDQHTEEYHTLREESND